MKIIPTNELITLLQHCDYGFLNLDDMARLFEKYGDDYYVDRDFGEYCKENDERKNFVELALIVEGARQSTKETKNG